MLAGRLSFGSECGVITEVHFQSRDKGWLLDDLLLVLEGSGTRRHCAFSLKSNLQVTQNGFPDEFINAIWEQNRAPQPSVFDASHDMLALGTARIGDTVKAAWDALLTQALGSDPTRIVTRFTQPGQSSAVQRNLFTSLHCPTTICSAGPDPVETARLIRSLRLFRWDFETSPSQQEDASIAVCRSVLRKGETGEAVSLWKALLGIASEGRTSGASYNLATLVSKLRTTFDLKDHPDYQADWTLLDSISGDSIHAIRAEIGTGIKLDRADLSSKIDATLAQTRVVAIIGESGTGKSALVASRFVSTQPTQHVVWLDRTVFDYPSQFEIATALGLRHTLQELFSASAVPETFLVLDALESFSTRECDRAIDLLKACVEQPAAETKVIVTSQPQHWDRLLRALFLKGVDLNRIARVDLELISPIEVLSSVGGTLPLLGQLSLRPELQGVLCNLKVLDWIVAGHALRSGATSFRGESDVIDSVWQQWVGTSPSRHERAAMLKIIGERDGDSLGSGVRVADLQNDERRTIAELESDQLLRVRPSQIRFTHDLLGDWARLQSLLSGANQVLSIVRQKATHPRWHAAIRLYAQRLLEQQQDTGQWRHAIRQLQADGDDVLAVDSFLDALVFAGNSEFLLERAWPDLVADNGVLLQRFLKRFLHVATIADPRVFQIAEQADLDWFAATFRLPYFLYWYPCLRVLERHTDDVCRLALISGAEVCELWLRTIPARMPGRDEASRLALKLAREAQGRAAEGGWFQNDVDRKVYEALLYAAPEFPTEVSEVALELCRRTDESEEIETRVANFEARRRAEIAEYVKKHPEVTKRRRVAPPPLISSKGPLRPQAPDGPKERVSDSFRQAAVSPSLLALAAVRPAIAREVVLAVTIDEPTQIRYGEFDLDTDYGTTHWSGGYPPMYFRGPFLRFLQVQPQEGIETIVRLVNYATGRWAESALSRTPAKLHPDRCSLEFTLPAGNVRWRGIFNQQYLWHRGSGPQTVASPLMALEKWFYDEIDAGRSIERWINQIFDSSTSMAFAGLLMTVGMRTPSLFKSVLRPLLNTWQIFEMQLAHATQDQQLWRIGMSSWAQSGDKIIAQVLEWHRMPHRTRLLRDEVVRLLLFDKEFSESFTPTRERWKQQLKDTFHEDLELLIARLDPNNYVTTRQADGDEYLQLQWPEHLRERLAEQADNAVKANAALMFPHTCRQFLDNEQVFSAEQAQQFWDNFQSVAKWEGLNDEAHRSTSRSLVVSAGIAVMTCLNGSWLRTHSEHEAWCLAELEGISKQAPAEDSSPRSLLNIATESFVGEASFGLMPRPGAEWVRDRSARGVTGFYYSSTLNTIVRAFRCRKQLGSDFRRAVNLMIMWAALRGVMNYGRYSREAAPNFDRPMNRLIRAYVSKRLSDVIIGLPRATAIARRAIERIDARDASPWKRHSRRRTELEDGDDKVYRGRFWLDTDVIKAGFGFLGTFSEASTENDRAEFIQYHSELLSFFLGTMPKLDSDRVELEGTPYEFDRWIFEIIARLIPQLSSNENPDRFWKPIVDLGPGARYWTETFLNHWFVFGLQSSESVQVFAAHWTRMIEYAFELPLWAPERKYRHYLAAYSNYELMGLGYALDIVGKAEFAPVLKGMKQLYKMWAERWLHDNSSALRFAVLLAKPSGASLLPEGVVWLNQAIREYDQYAWRGEELDEPLAGALRACWRHCRREIEESPDLRGNFLELLNILCKRLCAIALELRGEVATAYPGETSAAL